MQVSNLHVCFSPSNIFVSWIFQNPIFLYWFLLSRKSLLPANTHTHTNTKPPNSSLDSTSYFSFHPNVIYYLPSKKFKKQLALSPLESLYLPVILFSRFYPGFMFLLKRKRCIEMYFGVKLQIAIHFLKTESLSPNCLFNPAFPHSFKILSQFLLYKMRMVIASVLCG
jgi:hypothetical protein